MDAGSRQERHARPDDQRQQSSHKLPDLRDLQNRPGGVVAPILAVIEMPVEAFFRQRAGFRNDRFVQDLPFVDVDVVA